MAQVLASLPLLWDTLCAPGFGWALSQLLGGIWENDPADEDLCLFLSVFPIKWKQI